jgi:Ni,Fe-hydrogenase I small subunit
MELTRREFVTTLGVLAAGLGMSQTDLAKVTEAFAHGAPWGAGSPLTAKPKVIWVHGAECTGCSTSVLGLYEDAAGVAVPGATSATDITTAAALGIVAGGSLTGHRTLETVGLNVDVHDTAVNIADVLIDFIDLQYHETVMGMGGDGAYGYLAHEMATDTAGDLFVLVVEGAVQAIGGGGYWDKHGDAPWCAIAMDGGQDVTPHELSFDNVVAKLAGRSTCLAVVAVGQCAAFGGYPACIGPDLVSKGGTKNQTEAKGVYDFLISTGLYGTASNPTGAAAKVINVPGCPVNPWWFTLSVVAWLVDVVYVKGDAHNTELGVPPHGRDGVLGILDHHLAIKSTSVDHQRRLTKVYGNLLHGKYCPRFKKYVARQFATHPGEDGCLKNIGCKGLSTMSSCGRHGWNNQQPQNDGMNSAQSQAILYESTDHSRMGGACMTAGAPCMGCTEKGYPDAFTPFVVR